MSNGTAHMGTKEQHRTKPTKQTTSATRKKRQSQVPEKMKNNKTLGKTTATTNLNTEKKKKKA